MPLFYGCLACRKLLLSHPAKLSLRLACRKLLLSHPAKLSLSTMFSEACKHVLYLNKFLGILEPKPTIKMIQIYCNNTSTVTLAKMREAVHNQVKHVRTKVHHLCKMIANGYIKVEHKPTATITADLLTKKLSRVKFTTLIKHLQAQ